MTLLKRNFEISLLLSGFSAFGAVALFGLSGMQLQIENDLPRRIFLVFILFGSFLSITEFVFSLIERKMAKSFLAVLFLFIIATCSYFSFAWRFFLYCAIISFGTIAIIYGALKFSK